MLTGTLFDSGRKMVMRSAKAFFGVLGVLLVISLGAPSLAVASQPACHGTSCEGLNPSGTNCIEDARTLMSGHATTQLTGEDIGLLELRYSPKCHSNWVRFTAWYGIQAWLSTAAASGEAGGSPWIWRQGVANSLRGVAGRSDPSVHSAGTSWTAMVTADGVTCSSVSLYETETSKHGGSERRDLGPFNAPCIA